MDNLIGNANSTTSSLNTIGAPASPMLCAVELAVVLARISELNDNVTSSVSCTASGSILRDKESSLVSGGAVAIDAGLVDSGGSSGEAVLSDSVVLDGSSTRDLRLFARGSGLIAGSSEVLVSSGLLVCGSGILEGSSGVLVRGSGLAAGG